MLSEAEYSFDEYFQLGLRRKVRLVKSQLASPNTSNQVREQTFAQLRSGLTHYRSAKLDQSAVTDIIYTNVLTASSSVQCLGMSVVHTLCMDIEACVIEKLQRMTAFLEDSLELKIKTYCSCFIQIDR